MASVSKKIRELMDRDGYGQHELARRVGVSRSTVARWLAGSTPKLADLRTLASVFGTTTEAFLSDLDVLADPPTVYEMRSAPSEFTAVEEMESEEPLPSSDLGVAASFHDKMKGVDTYQVRCNDKMTFARVLRQLLADRGISQAQLAAGVGVSQSCISRWLQDQVPRADDLYRLAKYLGVSMESLLVGTPPVDPTPEEADTTQLMHLRADKWAALGRQLGMSVPQFESFVDTMVRHVRDIRAGSEKKV